MAKIINLLINTGNAESNQTVAVTQGSGVRGQATVIKAVKGVSYELQDPAAKNVGPQTIRAKRVGKDLHVQLEGSDQADLIIEDYYEEGMLDGDNGGLYGLAEDGAGVAG
jgi:hypothetical protein